MIGSILTQKVVIIPGWSCVCTATHYWNTQFLPLKNPLTVHSDQIHSLLSGLLSGRNCVFQSCGRIDPSLPAFGCMGVQFLICHRSVPPGFKTLPPFSVSPHSLLRAFPIVQPRFWMHGSTISHLPTRLQNPATVQCFPSLVA
jgi:hypothetical protein